MYNFGEFLRNIRKGRMTQRELAKKIGVGYPYISKLENNIESPPSDQVMIKIAQTLQVDLDELYIRANRMPKDLVQYILERPILLKDIRKLKEDDVIRFLLDEFREQIKNKEEAFWYFFDNSAKKMLIIDPDSSEIVKVNKAALEFYGFSSKIISNMKVTDINTLTEEEIFEEMKKAKLSLSSQFDFKYKLHNEKILDVKVISSPITLGRKVYLKSVIENKTHSNIN